MSLQAGVISTLKKYVFDPLTKPGLWKMLIMDARATQITSAVFRMSDLQEFGISAALSLYRKRQRSTCAIYIFSPDKTNVDLLISDFQPNSVRYSVAHVFFLSECPKDLLFKLMESNAKQYIKTLYQLDLDFITVESALYSFESREASLWYPLSMLDDDAQQTRLVRMAEQLATVCVTLREYPKIFYRKTHTNYALAGFVQSKLDVCLESNPEMGQGLYKDKSILLILDRGFDPISPILHELTLQAACYDLLHVENNMVTYDKLNKANVTDEDPLWREYRHKHIAHIVPDLRERINEFVRSKKKVAMAQSSLKQINMDGVTNAGFVEEGVDQKATALDNRELADLIKELPQYQAESARYSAVSTILKSCIDCVRDKVSHLCQVEQDLAMSQPSKGEITDPMRILTDLLKLGVGSNDDRLRLVLLFTLIRDGTPEGHLEKLLTLAGLDFNNKALFGSLSLLLGAQLIMPDPSTIGSMDAAARSPLQFSEFKWYQRLPPIAPMSNQLQVFLPAKGRRKDRVDEECFNLSRWSPYLLDVIENLISGNLDKNLFSSIPGTGARSKQVSMASTDKQKEAFRGPSARFQPAASASGSKHVTASGPLSSFRGQSAPSEHCGPRIIVFIVGGATWSEARTAYQVTEKCIETRLAESDRHATGRSGGKDILPGGGGAGWNYEVILGSTHMLTPEFFLGDLTSIAQLATSSETNASTYRRSLGKFHGL